MAVGLSESIGWDLAEKFLRSRLDRLVDIGDYPTIYIGSAGVHAESKNTLQGRYRELATRHTAQYPIWALLSSGWELHYGWMIVDDHPGTAEEALKERYQMAHGGRLPAELFPTNPRASRPSHWSIESGKR